MGGEVVVVMDMKTLSKYHDTMKQVERDTEILQNLRSRASPASPVLDGVPHGSGGHADRTAFLATECAAMEEKIAELEAQAAAELEQLERFISGVDDERAAICIRLRYIRFMPWSEISEVLGLWSASASRKIVSRYLAHSN
ncbi:MAG: hypothetical protein LUF28_08210 [Clostridiales bacterium]|nr:hypothetical protein [Clostridiales bacterium]